MSTRCQIGFYYNHRQNLKNFNFLIYKHFDGDVKATLPELAQILLYFYEKRRGLFDLEYASAFVVSKFKKDDLTNIGICEDFHDDIEFFYAVYADTTIEIYKTEMDFEQFDINTHSQLLKTINLKDYQNEEDIIEEAKEIQEYLEAEE